MTDNAETHCPEADPRAQTFEDACPGRCSATPSWREGHPCPNTGRALSGLSPRTMTGARAGLDAGQLGRAANQATASRTVSATGRGSQCSSRRALLLSISLNISERWTASVLTR